MNNNQQFDEHIKEQFSNYAPGVNPRIWENIVAERERRKPAGFWFSILNRRSALLLFCLLLAGGAATWIYVKNSPVNSNSQTTKNDLPADDQANIGKNDLPGNNITNEQGTTTTVLSADNTSSTGTLSANSNASLSSPGATKFLIYSPSLQADEQENIITFTRRNNNKRTNTDLSIIKNYNSEEVDENVDNFPGQGTLLGRLTYNAELISANLKAKKPVLLSFNPLLSLPGCPSIERDAAGNKKYFEFYAGPDFAFRSLSDTGNSAYLQKRKESAKFSSAYSAGIRYTKVFNNSMSIRGGINFSQINEKFTYVQGNLVQVTYIIDANGDTTGSYITTGTRYKTTHNKYRSIDVPIMLGYEIGNGRLHANINAGPVVNVYSWQKGEVMDTAYKPVNITTGKGSSPYQFKTNAGIGFMGAVSVYYRLSDNVHIMAEPYFRYNLSPMNKDNITLKQKYQTAGLRLGLRIDLK